jgi:hypothetical protein
MQGDDGLPDQWLMYFNGSYTLEGVGASVVLIPPEGYMIRYAPTRFPCHQQCGRI